VLNGSISCGVVGTAGCSGPTAWFDRAHSPAQVVLVYYLPPFSDFLLDCSFDSDGTMEVIASRSVSFGILNVQSVNHHAVLGFQTTDANVTDGVVPAIINMFPITLAATGNPVAWYSCALHPVQ
jgi:hypothetical protein